MLTYETGIVSLLYRTPKRSSTLEEYQGVKGSHDWIIIPLSYLAEILERRNVSYLSCIEGKKRDFKDFNCIAQNDALFVDLCSIKYLLVYQKALIRTFHFHTSFSTTQ